MRKQIFYMNIQQP